MKDNKQISSLLTSKVSSIGLLGGDAGKLLCRSMVDNISKEELENELDTYLEIVSAEDIDLDFCKGLAGLSWLFQFLKSKNKINTDIKELFSETDEYLHQWMMSQIKIGNYDFLHGAVGIGVYFLSKTSECNKSVKYIKDLITGLDNIAIQDSSNCVKFLSKLDPDKNIKGYNLSLAHGIASIIYFLANVVKQEIYLEKAAALLTGAINYLIKSKLPFSNNDSSIFPNWISKDYTSNSSRLAWCYGDLGIAASLYQAGIITKNKEWEDLSLDVLLKTAKRRDLEQNGVDESIFCHGTVGIGHVFHRMYRNTGSEEFKDAARFWFDETKKMIKTGENNDEFKIWGGSEKGWTDQTNILGGISGLILALHSWENDIDPDWDKCLLLS